MDQPRNFPSRLHEVFLGVSLRIGGGRHVCSLALLGYLLMAVDGRVFHLGIMLPFEGTWPLAKTSAGAVPVALDAINTDPALSELRSRGHTFNYTWKNTKCDPSIGLQAVVELYHTNHVDAFIGPACDVICEPAALLTTAWGIPMISYGCSSQEMSEMQKYKTFARTVAPYTETVYFITSIMNHFQWTHLTIITSSTHVWQITANSIEHFLKEQGMVVEIENFFKPDHNKLTERKNAVHEAQLLKVAMNTRVFLICADNDDVRDFMLHAYDLNLLNGDFAFINIDLLLSSRVGNNTWQGDDGRDEEAFMAYDGLLDISLHEPYADAETDPFLDAVRNMSQYPPFNQWPIPDNEPVDMHAFSMYDAIWLYALALNDSFAAGVSPDNTAEISTFIFNRTFHGMQAETYIDGNGDAMAKYTLRNVQNGRFVAVASFFNENKTMLLTGKKIIWPGGGTENVKGFPPCGWDNEFCQIDWKVIVAVTSIIAVIAGLAVIGFFIYRNRQREVEMLSTAWKIASQELHTRAHGLDGSHSQFGSKLSKATNLGNSIYSRSTTKSGVEESLSALPHNQLFSKVCLYHGQVVAVKQVQKPFVYLTKDVIHELNQVRSLRHTNVNPFVGACVEPNNICIVSSYCSKGSLQDVLENDNIKLDKIFKLAFANDIAQGMVYLHDHSPIKMHGRLKSANILIDSRWTCKVADMGLHKFREGEKIASYGEPMYYSHMLWTAPEHLREEEGSRLPSAKGDVYSFAIVLQEIMLRTGPYGCTSHEPKEIIDRVRDREHPPFRPIIPAGEADEDIMDLMRMCWEEIPAFRPNFVTIRDSLRKMNKGKQANLVDQMMMMMEKYADHLEDLVEDRTKQLAEEQKKTEDLLARMLPRSVAEALKRGQTVAPETFGQVTIFFSDIVGFTALAAASTPLEVVDFLNDLYTCFDNVIEHYDVYKVETIGDAYMVVSGLPLRNGIKHAGEISTMALDLMCEINDFKIRHMPDRHLQLRVGVHSGPAVSGVVGTKMPRYCLFGDTVNYASRMESSGLALRIHVSPEAKSVLDQLGGYHLIERGQVTMKGKGTITTYFLVGKDGFDKNLPDLSKAAPLCDHEFK